ncbi:BRO1-domain-containing protein [Trametes versicolor FP-101664 SS1]|uniref:BRO1-domain-containing protein n=1 Tax=Trametes versicolor (strain FP-101664) TaxID=717944 RepID=UPI0004623C99|nr:BRO1-domain-containing protein [Trametes versicolor FP-101664 SS1]EIW57583.1 BRO1-domain-containing protein [Trametes versicolor FP-101664 SS1]
MPNQLSIPCKKTYTIPIRQAVRDYILSHHHDTHPDAYRWDIGHWEKLRAEATSGGVHVDRVGTLLSYHAQLVFILTKLPPDIGLEIPYATAFDGSTLPQTLTNLVYERAAVLYNLAALYSQLGSAEDRSTPQGLKQAIKFYQNAAGALNYLHDSVLPQLHASLGPEDPPIELGNAFVKSLEFLMLAQAQECVWQRAVMDSYKNGLIAKLAQKVASFYGSTAKYVKDASPSIKHVFPSNWVSHLETKEFHFLAAAQYRKSREDLEAHRYGHELARLFEAQALAKKGYDIGRRSGVAQPVQQDIKSLLDNVQKNVSRAERDNDLIYHQDVPPASALPPITEVVMAQPLVDPGLQDPKSVVGKDGVIFGELLGWGARLAIEIYNDRRRNWITEEIQDRARMLDDALSSARESLNLPAALDALDRPIGLPPSLVKKAEEVRLESGPERIDTYIRDVQALAQHVSSLLDEAMDILDQEADEDEALRDSAGAIPERAPSLEANRDFVAKEQQYRAVLQQATDSDALVRKKWEEWEDSITQLTWPEDELELSIPSSTVDLARRVGATGSDPTRTHARALRTLLEQLEDLSNARTELVARVDRMTASDDITQRVARAASAMEQWVNVQPAMFEDILDEELSKYDRFRVQLEENGQKQEAFLQSLQDRHALFMQSRKDDAAVKERELALQSLDLAYHKYREIVRNLEEGQKFYNEFSALLSEFRALCKDYAAARGQEASALTRAMDRLALAANHAPQDSEPPAPDLEPYMPESPPRHPRAVLDLPPPDSDEWETMVLPPAPRPVEAKRRVTRSAQKST